MVDLSFLENFTKGDKAKMKRYISIYLKTAPQTIQEMEQNISNHNWDQLRINAHSLKPQADFMGIPELREALIEIEHDATQGQLDKMEALFKKAAQIHRAAEVALLKFINDIK